jgi:hypothetical protein
MAMKTKPRPGFVIFLAACALAIALPALAYQHTMSSTDIRNAYLLGNRKDSITESFFVPYEHALPAPRSGPFVATIGVVTPYSQIVRLGQGALNSDVQEVEQQFASKKIPFLVRVGVNLTDTYPVPPPSGLPAFAVELPNFQKDFKIEFVQGDKKIDAEDTRVYLLYSDTMSNVYQISGAIIEMQYDNEMIEPYDDATIKVQTPDNQDVETTFDLARLK